MADNAQEIRQPFWHRKIRFLYAAAVLAGLVVLTLLDPPVSPGTIALRRKLAGLTEVRVETLWSARSGEDAAIVLRGRDARRVASRVRVLWPTCACRCRGAYVLRFYRGSEHLTDISIHHGESAGSTGGVWSSRMSLTPMTRRNLGPLISDCAARAK